MTRVVNWYDVVVVLALLYGVWSGVRAGLTGEVIRVIGLIMMVAVALVSYQPAGDWIAGHSMIPVETAQLLAFVSIAVVVYLISIAVRLALHRRMKEYKFSALVENVGGGCAGVVRMTVIMAWLTVVLSLSADPTLRRNIDAESCFGSFIVHQLPALQTVVERSLPKSRWFTQDLKRRPEPNYEEAGATDTNTNRSQTTVP
ncbi:MAG TPA: CvpA family protein [Verrucomicrobiae bacterium]|nr:CvpA family protein [Verrucomicrobiae bacterium]